MALNARIDHKKNVKIVKLWKICHGHIGLDKNGYQVNIFLFLYENICCGYSLEVAHWGAYVFMEK